MIYLKNKKFARNGFHAAYTFLEVALALAIIAVVFAAVVPVFSAGFKERKLRDALSDIGQLVREVRLQAEQTGVDQLLVFQPASVARREGKSLVSKVSVPEGSKLFIRYPQGEWTRGGSQEWPIFAAGLVPPLSLRLQDGSDWIEADFDFLTGNVAEERYSF